MCGVSEVLTRWNSTFDMLARLLALRVPTTAVPKDGRITKVADQMLNLTVQQWKQVEDVCNLLEPFKGVTNSFSSSSDVTISTVLPVLFGVLDHCAEDDNESLFLSLLKRLLKQELPKKFHLDDVKLDSCDGLGFGPRSPFQEASHFARATQIRLSTCSLMVLTKVEGEIMNHQANGPVWMSKKNHRK